MVKDLDSNRTGVNSWVKKSEAYRLFENYGNEKQTDSQVNLPK